MPNRTVARLDSGGVSLLMAAAELFDEPPVEAAARDYLRDPRNIFLLATDGDEPVGFLRGTALGQIHTMRKQMFLYEIAVRPDSQRRGIGRALVEELIRLCRGEGMEEVFVFTDDPGNTAAAALYRSTGAVTETAGERMYVYHLK